MLINTWVVIQNTERRAAEINDLKREVQELKKLLQPRVGDKITRAAALSASSHVGSGTATFQTHRSTPSSAMRKLRAEDDGCSITVNTSRVKGDKTDFARIKTAMQKAIKENPALQGLQIRCLREMSRELSMWSSPMRSTLRRREQIRTGFR